MPSTRYVRERRRAGRDPARAGTARRTRGRPSVGAGPAIGSPAIIASKGTLDRAYPPLMIDVLGYTQDEFVPGVLPRLGSPDSLEFAKDARGTPFV